MSEFPALYCKIVPLNKFKKRDSLVDGWPMSVAALSRMAVNTAVNSDSSPFPSA